MGARSFDQAGRCPGPVRPEPVSVMPTLLYTASFYQPNHWVGARYRVSRAHPRGRRTDWETQPYLYPSRALLRSYQDEEFDFRTMADRYWEELQDAYAAESCFRKWLEGLADGGDLTLLCFEPAGRPCHRRVAAAWVLERAPGLELGQGR